MPQSCFRDKGQVGRSNLSSSAYGPAARHVLCCPLQSIIKEAMSNLRKTLLIPGEMEALRGLGQTAWYRGYSMLTTWLWFWCCYFILCLRIASYQVILMLASRNSFKFATVSPGFLRAGRAPLTLLILTTMLTV
jgi:hypothetical protein